MMTAMNTLSRCYSARRTYDHRLREAVCEANDPSLFDSCLTIPRSTARSWLRRGPANVVSLDEGDFEVAELRLEIAMLERRVRKYSKAARNVAAVARLQRAELEASGFSFENQRVPEAPEKARILAAVARARALLPLVTILKLVAFHVQQHNTVMPRSAFRGQTPDEAYFGTGDDIPDELAAARVKARRKRLAVNQAQACSKCEAESGVNSPGMQLRRLGS